MPKDIECRGCSIAGGADAPVYHQPPECEFVDDPDRPPGIPNDLSNVFDLKIHVGTFTITNVKTGGHRTIRIKQQPDNAKFAPGSRIIEILNGPNNERDFMGFGFINPKKPFPIYLWKSVQSNEELSAFSSWLNTSLSSALKEKRVVIEGAARCSRCNRLLTHPDSLHDGLGPECRKKI